MAFVKITINDNDDYCDNMGLTHFSRQVCPCTYDDRPERDCPDCEASGSVVIAKRPCELILSTINFEHLFGVLGIEAVPGAMDGRRLKLLMAGRPSECLVTEDRRKIETKGITWTAKGVSMEQAQAWYAKLVEICEHAEKREEQVVWG